ncbi:MAG TPA: GntR family transcriptional regulator [Trebonia sp.]|nr:GntR family transcriptional regulator [Trebonia sp.]
MLFDDAMPFGDASPPSTALPRPTSTQQVADYIRGQIFAGRLRGGDRVPQDEIAAELGVSRVPVREAVIALDREGWVMIAPHRGAFAAGLDEESARDHYELLGRAYGYGARRAASRATPDEVATLARVNAAVQAATDAGELGRLSAEFLRRLVALARSRRVSATIRLMAVPLVPGDFGAGDPEAAGARKRHLRALMTALAARDGEAAERELIAMLAREADLVAGFLAGRDRGGLPESG